MGRINKKIGKFEKRCKVLPMKADIWSVSKKNSSESGARMPDNPSFGLRFTSHIGSAGNEADVPNQGGKQNGSTA